MCAKWFWIMKTPFLAFSIVVPWLKNHDLQEKTKKPYDLNRFEINPCKSNMKHCLKDKQP